MKTTEDKIKELEEHIKRLQSIEELDIVEEYIYILTHILEIQHEYQRFRDTLL